MSTTGTNTFTVTRDDIIKAALRILQVIGVGETPIAEDYTNCSQALNIMIKGWSNNQKPLWVLQNIPLAGVTGVSTYGMGPTAGAIGYVAVTNGGTGASNTGTWTSTGGTTGTTASGTFVASGGKITSITVTNGGTLYTTTSGFTITFSTGSGCTYTPYIAGITMSRPLEIESGFIRDSNGFDTILQPISRQEYDDQGAKQSPGIPNQFYYDRQEPNGYIYLLNVPVDVTHTIYLRCQRQFYDMTAGTDNFDFPEEFFQALKWGLAAEIYLEYPVSEKIITIIESKAAKYIEDAFDSSVESTDITFTIDQRMGASHSGY